MAKKKKRKSKHRLARGLIISQVILILLVVFALGYYYIGGYAKTVSMLRQEAISYVKNADEDTFRVDETSIAYDSEGNTLSVIKGEQDRYYLTYSEIPQYALDAAVSVEDKKFYRHHGVDYRAIVRAVYAMLQDGEITQGASTITQQLARNVFLNQDKTWERKIEEIYVAVELEKKFTKNQILEFYLNNIYFGNGYYGLEAAAHGYFNTNASSLSVSQIAFLIGIPNSPSYYDPFQHMDHALERRDWVLKAMADDKLISESTYMTAVAETITLEEPEDVYHNYAETYMMNCMTRVLMEQNGFVFQTEFESEEAEEAYDLAFDEAYDAANRSIFTGGYRIYTSLNLKQQEALQAELDSELSSSKETNEEGIYALQGAAVLIDNNTGMVRAIVGGRTQEVPGYTLNRAYQSYRQPGSSIKPLVVYTPAIESLGYTAESIVVDEEIQGGPKNADGSYIGEMTLQRAVALSRNTIAWNLFLELTPVKGLSYLHAMNFQHITSEDEIPAASIGGLYYGVSPLEMAKAYATLENSGGYRNPSCIVRVTDADGNIIYDADQTALIVYEESAAREMTSILETVMTEGTARGYDLGDMPSAGKTGTTNEDKDSWFIGYTPYYTMSVWVGYDTPKTMTGTGYVMKPLTIWRDYMSSLHENLTPIPFLTPRSSIGDEEETEEEETEEEADVEELDGDEATGLEDFEQNPTEEPEESENTLPETPLP